MSWRGCFLTEVGNYRPALANLCFMGLAYRHCVNNSFNCFLKETEFRRNILVFKCWGGVNCERPENMAMGRILPVDTLMVQI